jgi:hypothetical protein
MGLPTNDLPQTTCCVCLNECLPLIEDSLECSTWNPYLDETTGTVADPCWLVDMDLMDQP